MEPPSTSTCRQAGQTCSLIRVVLVDDEPAFRTSVADLLELDGHEVLTFASAGDLPALGTIGRVSVLVTDYEMAGADGLVLADTFHAYDSTVPVILVTANRDHLVDALVAARSFVSLMEKPMTYEALHAHVHERAA